MTVEYAIKLLDPLTTAEEIRKVRIKASSEEDGYNKSIEAINEACEVACKIMSEYISREEHS